jgi:hypothetical protein
MTAMKRSTEIDSEFFCDMSYSTHQHLSESKFIHLPDKIIP